MFGLLSSLPDFAMSGNKSHGSSDEIHPGNCQPGNWIISSNDGFNPEHPGQDQL